MKTSEQFLNRIQSLSKQDVMNYAELVRLETAIETCQNIFKKSHNGIIKASKLLFFGEIIAEYQTKLDILKRNLN